MRKGSVTIADLKKGGRGDGKERRKEVSNREVWMGGG